MQDLLLALLLEEEPHKVAVLGNPGL